nr:hypothetical protein [uncultured Fluviicola sp.]
MDTYLEVDKKARFNQNFRRTSAVQKINDTYNYKSTVYSPKHSPSSDWQTIDKSTWIKPHRDTETISADFSLFISNELELKIPHGDVELQNIFIEAKYILKLEDNWDDEGALSYNIESWKSAANFIIHFYKWLRMIFSGSLHLPKMYHGPKGTIDVVWYDDNFRLFVNIDHINNKGSFYSDTPKRQYTEGEFVLNDFKFQMLPLPIKS